MIEFWMLVVGTTLIIAGLVLTELPADGLGRVIGQDTTLARQLLESRGLGDVGKLARLFVGRAVVIKIWCNCWYLINFFRRSW